MSSAISVNFGEPMPVFPLWDTVLLPHAVQPLHIFEPRYRQMIEASLDEGGENGDEGCGQIAMATFNPEESFCPSGEPPTLMPAVCIGQIIEHQKLPNGRYNILLHGVCRSGITQLIEPCGDRLYRLAMLKPLERVDCEPPAMPEIRNTLHDLLASPQLHRLRCVDTVLEWFEREEVTTHALLELVGFALVRDANLRYRLLAEPHARRRARLLAVELCRLNRLLQQSEEQSHGRWPKGLSWN